MNANQAKRRSDARIADNPTDELHQFETEPSVLEVREPAELDSAQENRGVLDGLKVIGLA
jgi:hypothetical protein